MMWVYYILFFVGAIGGDFPATVALIFFMLCTQWWTGTLVQDTRQPDVRITIERR
jgi:hypothetical protein